MFDRLVYLLILTIYTALAGLLLTYFEANVLFVVLILSVLPILIIWRLEQLKTGLLPILALISLGATMLFEAYAYTNGLWYELSPFEVRLFGLVPVEAFVAAFVHVLYFVVIYEYLFDDRKSVRVVLPRSLRIVLGGATAMLALGLAYVYVFSNIILSGAFFYLIIGLCGVLAVLVATSHRSWRQVLGKAALFALSVFPVSLVYEYVSLHNDLRFFANYHEYIYSFSLFGSMVPIEELVLILVVPFWLVLIYELYLDDGK
ncbi:hypothetical protein KC722_01100 [Candidatus Kaiserbacteria bacterium]|nr:hypothetical protein [Candidatus Kaiserbacteria bacterium]MCB9811770.1 hypothetical protein [Candidatus Nomurabacteria bacterium]